jgi:hypothetical protein
MLGLGSLRRAARERPRAGARPARWNARQTVSSALLYTLAFNLTFFIQELFLVLPKALTPGLRPTLFHNNHTWEGGNPLAELFQGTGALATLISGSVCLLLLRFRSWRSPTARLFLVWMAFSGVFMALPQVVIGAVSPRSDLGRAMAFLHLTASDRTAAAAAALILMPLAGWRLTREFLATAAERAQLASARNRMRFIFEVATLPALIAIPVIVLYRIPRELLEVVGVPVVVSLVGIVWVQAGGWRDGAVRPRATARESIVYPLAAVLVLLLVFQLVLRRGIPFYR